MSQTIVYPGQDNYIWSYPSDEHYDHVATTGAVPSAHPISINIRTSMLVADLMKDIKTRLVYLEAGSDEDTSFTYKVRYDKGLIASEQGTFDAVSVSASTYSSTAFDPTATGVIHYNDGSRYVSESGVEILMEQLNYRAKRIGIEVEGETQSGLFINKIGIGYRGRTAKDNA
jgi:hypothetical protein